MAELTPMMKQYMQIKAQHQDCILFFRLGDFYEMFCEDAKLAAKELELTLTTRDRGKAESEQTPMCGVPFHSAEGYIARLVAKGYKVAICEQTEDPATAKGLVSRDITRVVTPGAVTESSMLEERRNNYFASLFAEGNCWGLCFCDVSTGAIYATELDGDGSCDRVLSELARFSPAEALLGGDAGACQEVLTLLQDRLGSCIDPERAEFFEPGAARQAVQAQFAPAPQALLEPANVRALRACGALLLTLRQVQRLDLRHINTLEFYTTDRFMQLDPAAWRNLEITQTLRAKEKRGSLLWVLDHTKTAMGGRLLHSWLEKPLLNPAAIQKRLNAVEELTQQTVRREELILALRPVTDFERLMARIVTGSANCRDLVALAGGCRALPEVLQQLEGVNAALLQQLAQALDPLTDLCQRIDRAIVDDPPFSLREGGMIRPGYSEEVDQLRDIMSGGTGTLTAIEAREKEKTGIRNLRVGYNRVFGYYIEVSKGQTDLVPETYIRKQTLVNCERYITQELKDLENTILSAKDRICALEYNIFTELRQYLADQAARVQATAQAVAQLDVLSCFAALAVKHRYTKPTVDLASQIEILDGRHPVVEQVLKGSLFVPNDTRLGLQGSQV
ncbi:MAG: DNA mismatch repair protein MutS, partial [Oscillospiraceae bacterium]|nr:DNA mismatch repair protein MutS [Oscillospiraceae bacterium]